ncbi:RING-H2 finger protein ATL16 [Striga hermonthica]|uniref:RING-type E3 ubiquitin transferase n=1 Tax=Striga hermonthica TaxID=68872 RepID=A0A9N7MWQ0_STRHE|nr:RING-H2 finger protein ATL16 [Striga hermonthica]
MDPTSKSQSPIKSPQTPPLGPNHAHSPHAGFPIIAVAIIGILATAFLLVGYYIFVIKCCLSWHRIDILRRFSFSTRRQLAENPLTAFHSPAERRGLDEAAIRSIPIFNFKRLKNGLKDESFLKVQSFECAVCLNEFQEEEKLRVIPNCAHIFHIDCIDVWLQNNANCPLCRTSVSSNVHSQLDRVIIPSPPGLDRAGDFSGRNEDYVVIEIRPEEGCVGPSVSGIQENSNPDEFITAKISRKNGKKASLVSSMGDEYIDRRHRDESFMVQPLRRSFSMDSGTDSQLYIAVQEIIQRHKEVNSNNNDDDNNDGVLVSPNEGCSRVRRSCFTFGQGKGSSRSAVQPVELD